MAKNKLWQAIKGLTLAAGMAVGIFALGQTDVLADTLTLTVEKNTIGQGMILYRWNLRKEKPVQMFCSAG